MRKLYSIITVSIMISSVVVALGQSPAGSALRSSAESERRADSILSQMTLEEKLAAILPDSLTPKAALELLYELKALLDQR